MYCLSTKRRRAASSIAHGRLVAARTRTRGLSTFVRAAAADAKLLHCIKNSVLSRLEASFSLSPPDREDNSESISSTKIMLGDRAFARANRAFTSFSDSPSCSSVYPRRKHTYLETRVDADTEKKVDFACVATARASIV
jgi:hypothetical protein